MNIQYKQTVPWDSTLIDVGFLGSEQSVPLALRGLAINGCKITTGAPAATAGQWAPSAIVQNLISGVNYQNTGSTASPVWSIIDNSGIDAESTFAYNADATAGPATITAAQMVNAMWDRNGGATNRTDTTPTAALIIGAIPGAIVGSSFRFIYRNSSATAGQLDTLAGGSNVTISGNVVIAAGQTQEYIGRVTSVTGAGAVTLYAVTQLAGALAQVITASTVNTMRLTTAATAGSPTFAAVGSDTNIAATLAGKGTGAVILGQATSVGVQLAADQPITDSSGNELISFTKVASAVNQLNIANSATLNAVAVSIVGGDTDVSLTVNGKGAGQVNIGGTSTGLVILGRGANKGPIFSLLKTDVDAQNAAPTAAQWLGGYVTHNSQTGGGTLTTPTGAQLSAAITGLAVGDSFETLYQNRGNQTVTLTAGDGNVTLKGTVAIPTLKTSIIRFVNTGTNTWDAVQVLSA